MEAVVDLLQHHGELEKGENLVVGDIGQIVARGRSIAGQQFIARIPARVRGQCADGLPAHCGVVGLNPIAHHDADID